MIRDNRRECLRPEVRMRLHRRKCFGPEVRMRLHRRRCGRRLRGRCRPPSLLVRIQLQVFPLLVRIQEQVILLLVRIQVQLILPQVVPSNY